MELRQQRKQTGANISSRPRQSDLLLLPLLRGFRELLLCLLCSLGDSSEHTSDDNNIDKRRVNGNPKRHYHCPSG